MRKTDSVRSCLRQSTGPTGRQGSAARAASGLPAERRTCNWWAASVVAASVRLEGHQWNCPLESRLYFASQDILSDCVTGPYGR